MTESISLFDSLIATARRQAACHQVRPATDTKAASPPCPA